MKSKAKSFPVSDVFRGYLDQLKTETPLSNLSTTNENTSTIPSSTTLEDSEQQNNAGIDTNDQQNNEENNHEENPETVDKDFMATSKTVESGNELKPVVKSSLDLKAKQVHPRKNDLDNIHPSSEEETDRGSSENTVSSNRPDVALADLTNLLVAIPSASVTRKGFHRQEL